MEAPFAEAVLISRHRKIAALTSYLNIAPIRDLRDVSTPAPASVDEMGRSAQKFVMEGVVACFQVEKVGMNDAVTADERTNWQIGI